MQNGQILEEKKHKAHLFNLNFDPQLSGRLVHIFQVRNVSHVHCAYMEVGHLKSKCYINTSTAERQHGDWKHERQRIGHMYGGTWVRTAPFLPSVCVIFYDFLDVIE